jgi:alkylhydroperoxidase family enzyme
MARIDPLPPSEWTKEMYEAVSAMSPPEPRHPFPPRDGRPKGLNALGTFLHHPALARAFHTFNGHILFATTLSARQRELVILRVAHLRTSTYEWDQHVLLAHDQDITDDEIARVAAGPDADGWDPIEAALVRAADELLDTARISDDTWAVLAAELDTQQLLDLVFTVGAYDLIAMAFLTFGVVADPPADPPADA